MTKTSIKFFDDVPIRSVWDEETSLWWLCAVDVIEALKISVSPRKYWSTLIAVSIYDRSFSFQFPTQSGFAFPFRITHLTAKGKLSEKTDNGTTCLYPFILPFSVRFVNDFLAKNCFFTIIFFQEVFHLCFRFPKTVHLLRPA